MSSSSATPVSWHRLLGLTLTDLFTDTGYKVELEKDLSKSEQFLDVVVIEGSERAHLEEPPDGLGNLAKHNLLTYKSHQDVLDAFAIEELIGHFVNYRKQNRGKGRRLMDASSIGLYAVSSRFPRKLASMVELRSIKEGVYALRWGVRDIRVLVLSEMEKHPRNAPWLMFSAKKSGVVFGTKCYRWKRTDISTVINQLYTRYGEAAFMSYTVEDFLKEQKAWAMNTLSPEDKVNIMRGFPVEERLKGMAVEERLKGMAVEERLKGLSTREREMLKKLLEGGNS